MYDLSQIGYISTNTIIFAHSVIRSLEDMVGAAFALNKASFRETPFSSPFRMIAYIHFSGTIQGDYILGLDEMTAARLAGVCKHGMSDNDIHKMREDYGGFVKELLNLAVAQSILDIEQSFGNLTYIPATVVYGEIEFPDVMSGNVKIESEAGEIEILCGFSLNLAKLKISRKLDETLRELEKRRIEANEVRENLENILQKLPTGVVAINSACKVLPGHSHATASVVGYDPDKEIEGTELTALLGLKQDDAHDMIKWIRLIFSAYDFFPFEKLLMMCKDEYANQQDKILRLDWLPVVNHKTKTLEKLQVLIDDVTEKRRLDAEMKEKKKLEKQLRQVQKMEAVGTLASGIAHDFNNVLTVIMGTADLCIMHVPEGSKIKERLKRILKACYRAHEMVKQLLIFSRQTEQDRKPVRIEPVIKETLKIIRTSLPSTIEIRQDIQTPSGIILADPTQIHQIVMNLCINAGHAMEEKRGVLHVGLEDVILDDNMLPKNQSLSPGAYVKMTISDTGCGMSHDIAERIFEPFFTTKEQGKGTGMGLSVVHGIVASHGGAIKVYSTPEKGTTFHVFFPISERMAATPEDDDPEPIPLGNEQILFVDDEVLVTGTAYELLTNLGYNVVAETSSAKALNIFREKPELFDLVITDQTMPEITGTELTEMLIRIRPDIPVILCTGFSRQMIAEKAGAVGVRELLIKPFSRCEIAQAIRKVLDGK